MKDSETTKNEGQTDEKGRPMTYWGGMEKGSDEHEHKWRPVEAPDWRHLEICTGCKATRPLPEKESKSE